MITLWNKWTQFWPFHSHFYQTNYVAKDIRKYTKTTKTKSRYVKLQLFPQPHTLKHIAYTLLVLYVCNNHNTAKNWFNNDAPLADSFALTFIFTLLNICKTIVLVVVKQCATNMLHNIIISCIIIIVSIRFGDFIASTLRAHSPFCYNCGIV